MVPGEFPVHADEFSLFSVVLIKQWRKNGNQDNRKAAYKSYYFIFHISYKSHRFELQY